MPFNLPKQLRAFAWAAPRFDVFHFHAGLTLLPRRLNLPALRLMRKGIVFQSWGSDLRGRAASEVRYLQPGRRRDRRQLPHAAPRAARALAGLRRRPRRRSSSPTGSQRRSSPATMLRVAHAPSKRAVKGTDTVLAAVESLRARGAPIELDLIEGVPNREARLRYAAADVVVDQLRIGWYGMLAIESMALAKPVVVHLDEEAAAETEEAFGLELPLVARRASRISRTCSPA